jgi:hypothetical protein
MTSAANSSPHWSNITLGLRASDESDPNGWKEFANTIHVSTTYDHAPNTPTGLTTSPATACNANDIVGDGEVDLYAPLSDPDRGTLGATFTVTRSSDKAVVATSNDELLTAQSGSTVDYQLTQAELESWSGKTSTSPGEQTTFTWNVKATDFYLPSGVSATCTFTFDPTRPGTPVTSDANGIELSDYGSTNPTTGSPYPTTFGTIGSPVAVDFSAPSGSTPASYVYQLNGGAPRTVSATSTGAAATQITPTRFTNTLTVTATSAGANYGDTESVIFNSAPGTTTQADGDLTGDGSPDLLAVGGQDNLPAGLWLSPQQLGASQANGNGTLLGSVMDLGIYGSGINTTGPTGLGVPADYDGATVFTGLFNGDAQEGNGLQDVFVYYPTGTHAGTGEILDGNGDGSPLVIANSDANATIDNYFSNIDTNPIQLANGGFTSDSSTGQNAADADPLPDLIGTAGTTTAGVDALVLYPSNGTIAGYTTTQLSNTTPDGTDDWADWTLTTLQLPSTVTAPNLPGTAMFLWNKTTGELDLWEGLSESTDTSGDHDITYTPFQIAAPSSTTTGAKGWNTGAALTLQAADINGDGTPGLWAVGSTGTGVSANTATAYLFGSLTTAGPATVTTVANPLVVDTHSWLLDNAASGNTNAAGTQPTDFTGSVTLTGTTNSTTGDTGATWNTSDLSFNPDLNLDGTVDAPLTGSASAVNVDTDFSVSAWVKPNATGGVVLSQPGAHASGFILYPDTGTKLWHFCLATADTTAWDYTCADSLSAPVQLGVWAHLTATYNSGSGAMALYINGIDVAAAKRTALSTSLFTGDFTVGDYLYDNAASSPFDGELAQVETWNQTLTPEQVAGMADVTDAVSFPADGAVYPSGSNWTVGANQLSFNQGQLTVTVAGTPLYQTGSATSPNAVLTMQADGNLVAYPSAADAAASTGALWATGTDGTTVDTKAAIMMLQPDGNLVLYAADGTPLWATGTFNSGADRWQLTSTTAGTDTAGINPGVPGSAITWGANHAGTANAAAVLDGSDAIRAGAPAVITNQSYTVSCWVKISSLTGAQIALSQGTLDHSAFYLGYNNSNGGWIFQTTTADGSSPTTFPTADSPATANTWTELTGVYDSTTGVQQLYVNGVLKDSATNTTPQYVSSGVLSMGASSLAGSTGLYDGVTGSISDVRTYPNALSAGQVAAIYASS